MYRGIIRAVAVCATILLATGAFAAQDAESELEKGLKFGVSITNFRGDDASVADYKVGFASGGFLAYRISNSLAVQAEAFLVQKGSNVTYAGGIEEKVKLTYLEIPVLLKAVLATDDEGLSPFLYGGPAVGFRLKTEIESEFALPETVVKDTDIGIAFGGGFTIAAGSGHILFDARYTLGVTKIYDVEPAVDVRNGGALLLLGYVF